ncbi:uncharacterized protein FIBRA_01280 [Fibroporia radiculosa]|uniref:PIG-U-domain-containing protein n=1 Tax=Fibroporia radiculosa TaxID=599839 RepID=J4GJR7_9APHY|nr:uncharacterized protein FIBRA_01280 [Fibroporia radiculosa]CCL99265.1 predicted protein [Fibroporia radiculosa]
MDFSQVPVFSALVAARLCLALSPLPVDQVYKLANSPAVQEGVYLLQHGLDPYYEGAVRHSPLLLSLFSTVLPLTTLTAPLLWTACDAVSAWALVNIWRARLNVSHSSRDALVAASYLLNPYIVMPSLALSTSSYENALCLLALLFACRGQRSMSLLTFAFLVQLSLSTVHLVIPLMLLIVTGPVSRLASPQPLDTDKIKLLPPLAAEFILYSLFLTLAATISSGSCAWIEQSWMAPFLLPDLTPNTGLWWYYFTEMFDHFRPFFLMVFSVHLFIYVIPICLKFQHDILYGWYLLLGVFATFKSYPTLSDPGLFISMISVFPEVFPYLSYSVITGLLHLHASLLLPLFHSLWLTQGTGNANFFYASTLVFGMANGGVLLDSIRAGLRIAMGELKYDHDVVQE